MKLKTIYNDVISTLQDPKDKIRYKDVINLLNQNASELRVEFVQRGLAQELVHTEMVWATISDFEYPFLFSIDLEKSLMRSVPIAQAIQNSVFWKTDKELQDKEQSWSEGDVVIKGNDAYQAVADIGNLNTFNRTFENKFVNNFYKGSGLSYTSGDVVRNQLDKTYWIAIEDYTDDKQTVIADTGSFEQLYWKRLSDGYFEATYVPFSQMYQMKLKSEITDHYPFSIKDKKLYTTVDNVPFTISYVPEWEEVAELDKEFPVPDSMVQEIKNRTISVLAMKLGFEQPQLDE